MRSALEAVRRRGVLTFLLAWLAFALTAVSWSLATPLSASPDEPAQIIKAASVVRGQLIGDPTHAPAVRRVQVPLGLSQSPALTCYVNHPSTSAGCLPRIPNGSELVSADTSAGLYNPLYYALVGAPSLFTGDTTAAILGMRVINALLCSFFLAAGFVLLVRLVRPIIAGTAVLAGATPMVFFLSGVVNPNALEIASGFALLCALLLVVRGPDTQRIGLLLTVVAVSGVVLANTRGLSPLWMALIAVVCLIAAPPGRVLALIRRPSVIVTLVVLAIGVLFAVGWIFATGTLGSMGSFPGAQATPLAAFFRMMTLVFDPGLVGVFGWLDTFAPPMAYVVFPALAFALLLTAIVVARGREFVTTVVATAAFFLLPALVQAASVRSSGYIWQGRYGLLPYLVMIVIAAVAIDSRARETWTADDATSPFTGRTASRFVWVVGVLVAFTQLVTFVKTLKRYVVGDLGGWGAFVRAPQWAPPGGVLFVCVLALLGTVLLTGLWIVLSGPRRRTPALAATSRSAVPVSP